MKNKAVAVYCGAATGNQPAYQSATVELAHWLVKNHLTLVYGGGGVGLMGLLARTVLADGGQVQGIMPQTLVDRGAALDELSDLQVVANMSIRKQRMLELADACIALPGGPGTLEEIAEAYSWTRIGANANPCVLYNVNGYYNPLQQMFAEMVDNDFLTAQDNAKLGFARSLAEIETFIKNYTPPTVRKY
ncbi:TIGR00730 family Rossman fold protein [Fructilactobacillus carniphilus]|uniref:Cytokinin riboside 5'-monophosphate phosphoribohydrolase n=1 Tax=Fructilactobacillus carniphilus TaxID=2940297 RepID=A0ABY5BZ77_9LACO|nr:TIGR00730 family Rossman fold protein [Fructilactobacillus carniphilus]USS91382.1 TIGR00730 family Rossman fold protein [Fructilactobacillus carniphilus]